LFRFNAEVHERDVDHHVLALRLLLLFLGWMFV